MDATDPSSDVREWEADLVGAASSFDWPSLAQIVDDYVRHLRSVSSAQHGQIKAVLQLLRDNLRYDELRRVADAALAFDPRDAVARRQFAQALVDGGNPAAALLIYRDIVGDADASPTDQLEARGGVGRCYKQMFVATPQPHRRAEFLRQALVAYLDAYTEKPDRFWHGINAVALLARAQRDGSSPAGDVKGLAEQILTTVDGLPAMDAWAKATAAEALIALGRIDDAFHRTKAFVLANDADAFKVAALLRQIEEIWQLDTTTPAGDLIVSLLRSTLLAKRGGALLLDPQDVRSEPINRSATENERLEKVLGYDRYKNLTWYRKGLARCRAVAQLIDANDEGFGTGFLVHGTHLHPALPPLILMTNGHVVPEAPQAADAKVVFRGLDDDAPRQEFQIVGRWWYQPSEAPGLDTTLLELDAVPANVEPVPFAKRLPALTTGRPRAYVIGHPRGLSQPQFSLQDNALLDYNDTKLHYRSPTEGGSSGSPVFDAEWNLIGLHHSGASDTPRLRGGGTYAANEAIALGAIRARIHEDPPAAREAI